MMYAFTQMCNSSCKAWYMNQGNNPIVFHISEHSVHGTAFKKIKTLIDKNFLKHSWLQFLINTLNLLFPNVIVRKLQRL